MKGKSTWVRRGSEQRNSKLDENMVRELRRRYESGERVKDLVKYCDASYQTLWKALNKRTWRHVREME